MQQILEDVWTWRVWKAGAFRDVSFNGTLLIAGDDRIVIDPPPLNAWEEEHLTALGGATHVVVTNANHLRAAVTIQERFGAALHVPAADQDRIEASPDGTFGDGDTIGCLRVVGLADQKTPGESGLYWAERRLLVLGDALIGTPKGGLSLLPAKKYADVAKARAGLARLRELAVDALLLGDGDSILSGGGAALQAFCAGVPEVPLEAESIGRVPRAGVDGWYVVNLAEANWVGNDLFGTWSNLEGQRGRFRGLGVNVSVIEPGKAACLYHRESVEEDFLVLHGECSILIEEQERKLRTWDFVHCPPGARHVFVGGGDGPCAILMIGARDEASGVHYPVSAVADRYGASVKTATDVPNEAYGELNLTKPTPTPQAWPLA